MLCDTDFVLDLQGIHTIKVLYSCTINAFKVFRRYYTKSSYFPSVPNVFPQFPKSFLHICLKENIRFHSSSLVNLLQKNFEKPKKTSLGIISKRSEVSLSKKQNLDAKRTNPKVRKLNYIKAPLVIRQ